MPPPYEAKEYYQREAVAAAYDRDRFRGLQGTLVDWLEQRLVLNALAGLHPGSRVLDLPVGTGRMARRLAEAGYRVVGTDISGPMLAVAQQLGSEAEDTGALARGDAEALPFADKSFDAAVCLRLLSHLPPEARLSVLREMARVTDRVIAVYQPHKLAAWWLLNGLLLRKPVPRFFASANALQHEFTEAGLRPVRSHALLRGAFMERVYVLEPRAGS